MSLGRSTCWIAGPNLSLSCWIFLLTMSVFLHNGLFARISAEPTKVPFDLTVEIGGAITIAVCVLGVAAEPYVSGAAGVAALFGEGVGNQKGNGQNDPDGERDVQGSALDRTQTCHAAGADGVGVGQLFSKALATGVQYLSEYLVGKAWGQADGYAEG